MPKVQQVNTYPPAEQPAALTFFLPQIDNKGRNFLHVAVQNSDIESVLFLISVQANVNSRAQDASKLTPLHLAVQAGSEIIVRNLVWAAELLFPCSEAYSAFMHRLQESTQGGTASLKQLRLVGHLLSLHCLSCQ